MKRKSYLTALAAVGILASIISLSACQGTVTVTFSQPVNGTVVDARNSASGVGGATVTLTDTKDSSTYTATTLSDGSWTTTSKVPAGQFSVTVTKSGYFFPSTTVSLGNWGGTVPAIPGFQLSSTDASNYAVSFILMWDKSASTDLDLNMTYPNADYWSSSDNTTVFYSPYSNYANQWTSGFGPNNGGTGGTSQGRWLTNYAVHDSTGGSGDVVLDTDSTSGGPETMTMWKFPFAVSLPASYDIGETASNGLTVFPSGLTFAWMGVAELYINAPDSKKPISSTTSTTNAKVYVIQTTPDANNNPQATLLGTYHLPSDTLIQATSVIRVNMFLDDTGVIDYQIVPDTQIVPEGGGSNGSNFRSTAPVNAIIGVRGPKFQ